MLAKILCLSDLHKRWKDSQNIKGQLKVQQIIQEEILDYIENNGITHVIILGDWYDRGFHGLGQAYGSIEMDRRLSRAVNNNVYLCVGNHFYLERDENPEMYIIQPNAFIQPQIPIPMPDEPIFRVVQTLTIGTVQISFLHYNKINKEYIAYREPNTTFHIGIYHDDAALPTWIREQEGFAGKTSQRYLNSIYANIDLAIHGHIHSKIGTQSLTVSEVGRTIPLIVPGALGITANVNVQKHPEVDLPVLTINDDSTVTLEHATFNRHLNLYMFNEVKKRNRNRAIVDGMAASYGEAFVNTESNLGSLTGFLMAKGYDDMALRIVDLAAKDELNASTAIQAYQEVLTGDL